MSFKLGRVVATPAALKALEVATTNPLLLIGRHLACDWGDVCKVDWKANDDALKQGSRLFSVYTYGGTRFYVITEHDRSSTCLMLPSDY